MNNRRKAAFTLVELLVVLFIVAILIMAVLAAMADARRRGRDVQCMNHLRELHIGAMNHLYAYMRLPASRSAESYDLVSGPPYWYQGAGWVHWRDWEEHPDNSSDWSVRKPGRPDVWWGPLAMGCVTQGSLWRMEGQNLKTYLCPAFARPEVMGSVAPDGSTFSTTNRPVRSYCMNSQAGGIAFGSGLANGSRRLLFADGHPGAGHLEPARDGSGPVRACRQGLLDNQPAASDSYYISIPDPGQGYVEPCSYDGELTGIGDPQATPAGAYPIESVGTYHGGRRIGGVDHPVGYGVFLDGHIETITWWQTTNACSANW